MEERDAADYYETLQISPNADPDTVQRVYRLLAQRYHPDNPESGDEDRFREVHDAYAVLSDPARRAGYDAGYDALKRERWRFAAAGPAEASDFALEQHVRAVVLEILYARRRLESHKPGLSLLDLSNLTGRPREHLEFTTWYLVQRRFLMRDDHSNLAITAEGVDYLEERGKATTHRLRLSESSAEAEGGEMTDGQDAAVGDV